MWWQKHLSEEQQVEKIRKTCVLFLRWQKPLWMVVIGMLLLVLFCSLDFALRSVQIVEQGSSIFGSSFLTGYLIGGFISFLLGLFLGVVFGLILLASTETKSWDLMLKYHDRLQQAGLLPVVPEEKIEAVSQKPPRS